MEMPNPIERSLERALSFATATERPPRLCAAMRHAVFSGGARVRPRLCLAVAAAAGNRNAPQALAAATAIELLHCASLVHDDMPCFDGAAIRRGAPSVQARFGEPLALLTGDALIVLAFETLARECALKPGLLAPLTATVARAVGAPHGIVAGQAWECEESLDLDEYHRSKTAALFMGAASLGAIASEADPQPWMAMGEALGAAYQVADDLRDIAATVQETGKPCDQDAANGKPNCAAAHGVAETVHRLGQLVEQAVAAIPDCPGGGELAALIRSEAKRLMPEKLANRAA